MLVDLIDDYGHMFETLTKEAKALGFDLLKLLATLPGCSGAGVKGYNTDKKIGRASCRVGV